MWFAYSLYYAFWTSISSIITKKLTNKVNILIFFLTTNVLILLFMAIVIFIMGGFPQISPQFYKFILFSSVLDMIAFLTSLHAIKNYPISLITPMSSFNPVFTTLIAAVFLGETSNMIKLLGILIIVLGAYFLNIADIKKGIFAPFVNAFKNRGVQLFLLANFLWALTPIFQKKAIFSTQPVMPAVVSFFGIAFMTIFIVPFTLKFVKSNISHVKDNLILFLILSIFSVFGQISAFTAFSLTNLGYATAVFKLSPLFTVIWGALFFKEERIKERFLGAGVMVLGTILLLFS